MSEERNEPVAYTAWDGGAKVLSAILEALDHGGSVERALDNGRAALRDLRPKGPTV